jgi:hypothetical protein
LKKLFIIHFIFICVLSCTAQLISTKPVDIPVGPVNFNSGVVMKNKIKTIVLNIVDKPDGKIIVDKGSSQGFEFDEYGRVTRYYYTVLNRTQSEEVYVPAVKKHGKIIRAATTGTSFKYINDTIFSNIFYDDQNRVILKRLKSGDYYDAYYYEYNEQGRIRKEMHCKETNVSENKKEFKLGVQTVLSSETFEYEFLTATQLRKKCMNDEGREYKKGIIDFDSKGNKISERYDFIVSWMHQENLYEYNNLNYITKHIYTGNDNGSVKLESTYDYDNSGLLITEKKIKETVVQNEISYLFDDTTKLVKSHVDRDFKNASIGIVRYAYTFY